MKKQPYTMLGFILAITWLASISSIKSADVISGHPEAAQQPFPFELGPCAFAYTTQHFFVGAQQTPADPYKALSITAAGSGNEAFFSIAPETCRVDNVPNQNNPIYGSALHNLCIVDGSPLLTISADPTRIFTIRDYNFAQALDVIQSPQLPGEVVALGGHQTTSTFMAALKPIGGNFGDAGSALATGFSTLTVKDPEEPEKFSYTILVPSIALISNTSPALMVGSPLTSFGLPVAIHGADTTFEIARDETEKSTQLTVTYVGLNVIGGAGTQDGARALCQILSEPIVADNILESDSIIGGRGPFTQATVHHIATLHTTTLLDYVIIVGGVGPAATTQSSVWCLPIINYGSNSGKLAHKDAIPSTLYYRYYPYRIMGRTITTMPTQQGDLFSPAGTDSWRARVGGSANLPGPVTKLFTLKDTVFAQVTTSALADEHPGLYFSQAIFDAYGRVSGFTDWLPAGASVEGLYGSALDQRLGLFWSVIDDGTGIPNLVTRTAWNKTSTWNGLVAERFYEQGGIQGVTDIPRTHPLFSQILGQRSSLVIATGHSTIMLAQSGADRAGNFEPTAQLVAPATSQTGGTDTVVPGTTDYLIMQGGALESLGALVTATVATDGTNGWIVVGGANGAALLTAPDGTGLPQGTLAHHFGNCPQNLSFKRIDGFSRVRKVLADGNHLYLLTSTELRRIDLSQALCAGTLSVQGTLLAQASKLAQTAPNWATFSDVTVSGPLALLATSQGLFRSGNSQSVATTNLDEGISWEKIDLPEGVGPATQLWVISPTGLETQWATTERGGLIYVLAGTVSRCQTRLYRCAVEGLGATGTVTNSTVQPVDDRTLEDYPSFLYSRGLYRNFYATDGATMLMSRSAYAPLEETSLVEILPDGVRRGFPSYGKFPIKILAGENQTMPLVGPITYRSALGCWLIAGSYLRSNE